MEHDLSAHILIPTLARYTKVGNKMHTLKSCVISAACFSVVSINAEKSNVFFYLYSIGSGYTAGCNDITKYNSKMHCHTCRHSLLKL